MNVILDYLVWYMKEFRDTHREIAEKLKVMELQDIHDRIMQGRRYLNNSSQDQLNLIKMERHMRTDQPWHYTDYTNSVDYINPEELSINGWF